MNHSDEDLILPPRNIDFSFLAKWNERDFCDWLGTGVATYLEENSLRGFRDCSNILQGHTSLLGGLMYFYKVLPVTSRRIFTNAVIKQFVYSQKNNHAEFYLALGTSLEIVDLYYCIPDAIVRHSRTYDELTDEFFRGIVYFICNFSTPVYSTEIGRQISRCLDLISESQFLKMDRNIHLARLVFVAMCRLRPTRLGLEDSYSRLKNVLFRVYGNGLSFVPAMRRLKLISEVSDIVGYDLIKKSFKERFIDQPPRDRWWYETIDDFIYYKSTYEDALKGAEKEMQGEVNADKENEYDRAGENDGLESAQAALQEELEKAASQATDNSYQSTNEEEMS